MFAVFFLLLTLDWAKTCKPVNYKFTQYKNKQQYVYGCKMGCLGYKNDSTNVVNIRGTKFDGDRIVQDSCVECKTITKDFFDKIIGAFDPNWGSSYTYSLEVTDELLEGNCNGVLTSTQVPAYYLGTPSGTATLNLPSTNGACFWNSKKKKCGTGSCPHQASIANCWKWKNGKCEKINYDDCPANGKTSVGSANTIGSGTCSYNCDNLCYNYASTSPASCNNLTDYYYNAGQNVISPTQTCTLYKKFTADHQKECKYRCEHKNAADNSYEYSKAYRKQCNKLLGCMYGGTTSSSRCSHLAIWAFIVILVIAILVVVAIIAAVCFLIFKFCCGSKSAKVDPAADKAAPASKSAPAAAPATQAPPPEVGPYVVIKLGKQESKTKKVESAVWGESVVLTDLSPEDDDVSFELHDNSGALLGSANVRIPDYVNAKKRAAISLKNGEANIGLLEVDIEVQVEEEPEEKITGVFFVDKFAKA